MRLLLSLGVAVVVGVGCGAGAPSPDIRPGNHPPPHRGDGGAEGLVDGGTVGTSDGGSEASDGGTSVGADAGSGPAGELTPDGGILSAQCDPSVENWEGLEEPAGGWDSWITLPPDYREPALETPSVFSEGSPCVTDTRPRLDTWCEQRTHAADGSLIGYRSSTRPPAVSLGAAGSVVLQYDQRYSKVREDWTFDSLGRVVEWKQTLTSVGETWVSAHWLLRFACDGRPSRYQALVGGAPPPMLYDKQGRVTRWVGPREEVEMSWAPSGALLARSSRRWSSDEGVHLRQRFDDAGRVIAEWEEVNTNMRTWRTTKVHDLAVGRSRTHRDWGNNLSYEYWVTQSGQAAQGGEGLSWTARDTVESGPAIREARRTTYSCETGDAVEEEIDSGADGSVDETLGYAWIEDSAIIRRSSSRGGWTDFHFRCQ